MCQREAAKLVEYLANQVRHGYTIVTWNGLGFDFDILAEESGMLDDCQRLARDHVDMMFHVVCQLGFGVSLDSAARGMGLSRKHEGLCGGRLPGYGRKEGEKKSLSTLPRMCGSLWNWRRHAKNAGVFDG